MKIALFVESPPDAGGGFQQSLSTVHALLGIREHEFVVFTPLQSAQRRLRDFGIESIVYRSAGVRLLDRLSATVTGGAIFRRLRRLGFPRLGRHLDALLDDHAIDLVVMTNCAEAALRIADHHYLATLWDMDHRDRLEFPEKYVDRVLEQGDRRYRASLTRALAVIANSASGARRISSIYQIDSHRIVVLPFLPSLPVRRHRAGKGGVDAAWVKQHYRLPERFLFYPAFFSSAKNHLYILEGLLALQHRHGIRLDAVFCGGGDPPDEAIVRRQIRALGLEDRVHLLGLVPDEHVPPLYEMAECLVMPSYTGPTNLPPIEAAWLGCPVIVSDMPGCREQMGDAALYCDLADPGDLAFHLHAILTDNEMGTRLKRAGRLLADRLGSLDYGKLLAPIFQDYAYKRRRWTWPPDDGATSVDHH